MNHKSVCIGIILAIVFILSSQAQPVFLIKEKSIFDNNLYENKIKHDITWKKRTSMPGPLYAHASAIIGDTIQVVGGRGKSTELFNYHYVYNILQDVWEEKPPLPVHSSNLAAVPCGKKIYVIGGNENPEKIHVFNPENEAWRELSPMPTPRQHINYSAIAVDNKIFVIGGIEKRTINGELQFNISEKNEIYDPDLNSWSEGAPLPTARQAVAVAAIGGRIYAIGGSDINWDYGGTVEVYDVKKNTWETKAELPDRCFPAGIAVIDEKIFVISGIQGNSGIAKVFVYDPVLDEWQYVTDTQTGVRQSQMVSYKNKLFLIGGVGDEAILSFCIEGEIIETKIR